MIREANYQPPSIVASEVPDLSGEQATDLLKQILGSLNVASKHWVIRQYDHEVQGGSAVKPLVGPQGNGPGDAAVVRPRLESRRGVVISCGMNPAYGDFDPYHMAASAIDEAVRNAVAVGADPNKIAILDNFCWGNTDRPETLGSLVRAALACYDVAVAWKTPFISGKDSLNNEFTWTDADGEKQNLVIPPSLLISAMGQVDNVGDCVTMDCKEVGNPLYLIGATLEEFGGSHLSQVMGLEGGQVPVVNTVSAKRTFDWLHNAIKQHWIRACHDLSEGGLAVAVAEMAFAGELGVQVDIAADQNPATALFAESNSRFVVEVAADSAAQFEAAIGDLPVAKLGQVTGDANVALTHGGESYLSVAWKELYEAWHQPLDWA